MTQIIKTERKYVSDNKELPSIWVVTTFNMHAYTQEQLDRQEYSRIDSRSFGWFPTEEEAVAAVLNNSGDIWEFYYDYAVIEEIACGIHGTHRAESWFQWQIPSGLEAHKGSWVNIQKPLWSQNIINWSIG